MKRLRSAFVLLAWIALCFGAAALGSTATAPAIGGWYRTLAKPEWTPPDSVFGPVWTALYLMMAVAAWLVWRTPVRANAAPAESAVPATSGSVAPALTLFVVQLALNVAWSWIFFGMRMPGWAAVEIVALWLAIAGTTLLFFRHSSLAGWLMTPYLAWVAFAAALNVAIWRLNVDRL
ncbi:MAG TPA: TspO/MBR family protein [Pirellulaceae bacterium]|nr:TspO/MBR family protein [Pirellulaceae bacterium]